MNFKHLATACALVSLISCSDDAFRSTQVPQDQVDVYEVVEVALIRQNSGEVSVYRPNDVQEIHEVRRTRNELTFTVDAGGCLLTRIHRVIEETDDTLTTQQESETLVCHESTRNDSKGPSNEVHEIRKTIDPSSSLLVFEMDELIEDVNGQAEPVTTRLTLVQR